MRFEDVMPAIRAGRRVRRSSWESTHYVFMEFRLGMPPPERMTKRTWASYGTWPSDRDLSDLTAEDWEMIPEPPKDGYLNGNYRDAIEAVNSESRKTEFSPKAGWEVLAKECVSSLMEAFKHSKDEEKAVGHLIRAAVDALGAVSAIGASRDVKRVMED